MSKFVQNTAEEISGRIKTGYTFTLSLLFLKFECKHSKQVETQLSRRNLYNPPECSPSCTTASPHHLDAEAIRTIQSRERKTTKHLMNSVVILNKFLVTWHSLTRLEVRLAIASLADYSKEALDEDINCLATEGLEYVLNQECRILNNEDVPDLRYILL